MSAAAKLGTSAVAASPQLLVQIVAAGKLQHHLTSSFGVGLWPNEGLTVRQMTWQRQMKSLIVEDSVTSACNILLLHSRAAAGGLPHQQTPEYQL